MIKGTKLYSIVANKCPRCQRGNFFAVNNPYNLKQFAQMNPQCACCGERFEREPGYSITQGHCMSVMPIIRP